MKKDRVTSKRISKTAEIILNENINYVFPLFGAFEERKWAEGGEPILIYPDTETIEEGTTFKTPAHGHGEDEFLWIVSKYLPEDFFIQYLVVAKNRFWTITIKCEWLEKDNTLAKITYTYTGLNDFGNHLNEISLSNMYKENLKDWERDINNYLRKSSQEK